MFKSYKTLIFCLLLSLAAGLANSGDILLPQSLPSLEVTSNKALGTLEPNTGRPVGHQIENFSVASVEGEPTSLHSLLARGKLMVVFYRGGWCPYCNVQVRQLSVAAQSFFNRGVTPVLISADKPDAAMLAKKAYEIPFPVLSDPELAAHKAFNVVYRLEDKFIPVYKDYGIVLSDWSGKDHQMFAVASVFILDSTGKVLWAHSSHDYKTRPSVEQLIDVIKKL